MRPLLYPVGISTAFVAFLLVRWGVSPYAAGRPLMIAVALGLILPWLFGLLVGDRDRAGLLAVLIVMLILVGQSPISTILLVGVFLILLFEGWARRQRPRRILGSAITRAMSGVTSIIVLAVVIAAVQGGRIVQIPHDLIAEMPVVPRASPAMAATGALPSVYLILLDGYPRADKLAAEFGIDNQPFLRALGDRAFTIGARSRSNYLTTELTLASMFSGRVPGNPEPDMAEIRPFIGAGEVIGEFRERGYEVVAFSTGFEGVALRQAERFVDSGQLNEFEWELLQLSGLAPVLDVVAPTLLADQHRERVLATFEAAGALAGQATERPRFVFAHTLNPHSPQVFGPAGEPIPIRGIQVPFDDSDEYTILGRDEYGRRLADQIAYLNRRVLGLVDAAIAADPRAVVIVFSDHGSGIREAAGIGVGSDPDLRTANLLAVRSPGQAGIIDDRSTLVNILPRILRAYSGSGPADVPETVYGQPVDGQLVVFDRPD
jgi:hypothetical protein